MIRLYLLIALTFLATPASAYLGPGMGAGAFGVFLGIIASLFIAIFAIVWYPLKRYLKKRKQANTEEENPGNDGDCKADQ
ncbi:hypothetical protein [Neptuniibacter sp.]|uniref:hypothetical protein n=1 Tax=Neptuniibacter sp. TaxID=1962643 RepID=UPI002603E8BB|nr:hypothetical protein [Neptuniibacter sp.]MCP4598047.1 hypothetical protein [Neptuniibacter sp.]